MTSTISKLLKETNEKRKDLLHNRDYEAARTLRQESFAKAASIKVELEAARVKEQLIECRRLEKARALAIQKVEDDVEVKLANIEAMWAERGRQLSEKTSEREVIALELETRREAQKPVVLSSYVRDLQRSEKRLAEFHLYEDSAAVRRKIQKREIEEREQALQDKQEKVEKAMSRKKEKHTEELRCFKAKMRNDLAIAKFHAQAERERINSMYNHLQRDISHDQERESQVNPLLAVYAKPRLAGGSAGGSRGGGGAQPTTANGGIAPIRPGAPRHEGVGSAGQTNATKGTAYFRKMQGSRFDLPSLCDIYGHTLDAEEEDDQNNGTLPRLPHSARARSSRKADVPQQQSSNVKAVDAAGFVVPISSSQSAGTRKKIVPKFNKSNNRFLQASHGSAPLTADGMLDGSSYVS